MGLCNGSNSKFRNISMYQEMDERLWNEWDIVANEY